MSDKTQKKKSGTTKDLLQDKNVQRWYDNTSRGSKLNADIRLRRLNLFCYRTNTTPSSLVKIGRKDVIKLENILLDHVSWLELQNYAPNYIDGIIKSIKSWLVFNYIEPKRKIRIANAGIPVNIQDEQVPTKEQLQSILNVSSPRTRASISLMAFSGIRPQVMGNYNATDGLKLADLNDLVIADNGKTVSFAQIPAMVTVRVSLSKTKNKYFTFLPAEGCEYVLGYLRKRISSGERLDSYSPIISLEKGYQSRRRKHKCNTEKQSSSYTGLITTPRITSDIRKAIWSITKARPYVLRAYFDTQLLLAESHGKMTHAYRQFFMGHKGDIEARYTTNKGRLTDEMISDMRRAYSKSQQFLCTINNDNNNNNSSQNKKEMLLDMWREQAKLYGIDPVKIKIEKQKIRREENNNNTSNDTHNKIISNIEQETDAIRQEIMKMMSSTSSVTTSTTKIQRPQQKQYDGKIIKNDEQLLRYICHGWEPIKELTQNRVIIRKQR